MPAEASPRAVLLVGVIGIGAVDATTGGLPHDRQFGCVCRRCVCRGVDTWKCSEPFSGGATVWAIYSENKSPRGTWRASRVRSESPEGVMFLDVFRNAPDANPEPYSKHTSYLDMSISRPASTSSSSKNSFHNFINSSSPPLLFSRPLSPPLSPHPITSEMLGRFSLSYHATSPKKQKNTIQGLILRNLVRIRAMGNTSLETAERQRGENAISTVLEQLIQVLAIVGARAETEKAAVDTARIDAEVHGSTVCTSHYDLL